jgi:hypothetical protein
MKWNLRFMTFCLIFYGTMGFFPRPGPDGDYRTKTHFDITATGIFKAISIYVVKHKGASSITEFFKDGKKFVFNKNTVLL